MKRFAEYQAQASRTMPKDMHPDDAMLMLAHGLVGELGELTELHKKERFHGVSIPSKQFKKELGDVFWYLANLATMTEFQVPPAEFDLLQGHAIKCVSRQAMEEPYLAAALTAGLIGDHVHAGEVFLADWWQLFNILCVIAESESYSLGQVLELNIDKLRKRYPDGFVEGGGVR